MNLLYIIGFGLKVSHLIFLLCCWFLSLISLNWLSGNERSMTTAKASLLGGGHGSRQIWIAFRDRVSGFARKIHHHSSQYFRPRKVAKNWRKVLITWMALVFISSLSTFWYMSSQALEKRKYTLASMCDERARMLQDQFNVSMNHIQAMSVMISIFHHGKTPSAIDQSTFARFTERTSFERPLTSGVAYAVRVLHGEREGFEIEQGWTIKRMDNEVEKTPVHEDEYDPADLDPSPVQEEYAPVIFAQETVAHVISVDMLSGKEDRENVLRARESGKGVLTAPFKLLKTNRLGVILTFAVYKRVISPNATSTERIQETSGYLGGIFDIESLVEKLLQQLASKQTILVNVYDTTNVSHPISMYGLNTSPDGNHRVSPLNFGDPFRKHEMHCRFKQKQPWPWAAICLSVGIIVIASLVAQIVYATVNRIVKVEDDFQKMMELQKRAVAADTAKSQFLATVSHEIRTPMNGVLGMLQMLMDTSLDETQQDYVRTARESGKALVCLINEVLDQAKIESGKLELEAVSFDLRAILDDVLSLFSGKSLDKKVELAVYVSSKVPSILVGDPGRFRQIVTNLVGNSIKFTNKGHIFVAVHLVEEVLEMEAEAEYPTVNSLSGFPVVDRRRSWSGFKTFNPSADQVNVIVSVEDTGQGIPLEYQTHVFNPFVQVGPSITRTHGGTGIGLSISKCLVHLMKGDIGLASLPGVGSTFTFTAVFTNGYDPNNNLPISISSEFQGTRALLVDSNPVRAKVSGYHIRRMGINVEVVSDISIGLIPNQYGPLHMVFVEEEIWNTNFKWSNHSCGVSPKTLILSNTSRSSFSNSGGGPSPFVVMKPLRASMLVASLQRAMGMRDSRGNQELLHTLSLSNLLQGRRILVVDDNPVNLRVAAGALKKYGADVVNADMGRKAIRLLTPPHLFHACFMDIQMPEMDGFEATKQIRGIESRIKNGIECGELSVEAYGNVSNWHVPILAMTADVIQATSEACSECGMDGYVSKPFEADQLYREVTRFFQTLPNENH